MSELSIHYRNFLTNLTVQHGFMERKEKHLQSYCYEETRLLLQALKVEKSMG